MVASSRFPTTVQRGGLVKRTLLYVASFGVGSLLIAGLLSLVLVSVAEGVLPARDSAATPSDIDAPAATGAPTTKLPARKRPSTRRPSKPPQRPTGATGLRGAPGTDGQPNARPGVRPSTGSRPSAELNGPHADATPGGAVPL